MPGRHSCVQHGATGGGLCTDGVRLQYDGRGAQDRGESCPDVRRSARQLCQHAIPPRHRNCHSTARQIRPGQHPVLRTASLAGRHAGVAQPRRGWPSGDAHPRTAVLNVCREIQPVMDADAVDDAQRRGTLRPARTAQLCCVRGEIQPVMDADAVDDAQRRGTLRPARTAQLCCVRAPIRHAPPVLAGACSPAPTN